MEGAIMIHIENLVKRYGDLVALNHLNLDIHEGEIFVCLALTVPEKQLRSTVSSLF